MVVFVISNNYMPYMEKKKSSNTQKKHQHNGDGRPPAWPCNGRYNFIKCGMLGTCSICGYVVVRDAEGQWQTCFFQDSFGNVVDIMYNVKE